MNLLSSCFSDSLFIMTACFGVILIAVLGVLAACGSKSESRKETKQDN